MIPWKTYWTAGGAVATGSAAALMALADFPTPIAILFLLVAAVGVMLAASKIVAIADVFANTDPDARQTIVRWITAAAGLHVVWGAAFMLQASLWPIWFLVLAGLAALEYWTAVGHEFLLERRARQQELVKAQTTQVEEQQAALELARQQDLEAHRPAAAMRQALNASDFGWLELFQWSYIVRDGRPVGAWFDVRIPTRRGPDGGKKVRAEAVKLDTGDAETIAIGVARTLKIPLQSDWVTIDKQPEAGIYRISVVTENVLGAVIPYVDKPQWRSINDPVLIGYQLSGEPLYVTLDQHWADLGMSRSGKTSLINVKIANLTLCSDAVLWICGTEKLVDLVWPWVAPFIDTNRRLPIDWIAAGPWDTVRMLVAAFRVARWRQKVPPEKRGGFKKIIVILDEASFALVLNQYFDTYQDQALNMTQAVAALVKGAGSAGVHIHLASQRGTYDNLGDSGGTINANLAVQTVFATNDESEIGRALGDFKLPVPKNKGECWIRPGTDAPIVKVKVPYIQEVDPQRKKLHDGATVSDVAWARRDFVTDLDPASAVQAGEHYAHRFTTASAALYRYLTGGDVDLDFAFDAVEAPGAAPQIEAATSAPETSTSEPQTASPQVAAPQPEPPAAPAVNAAAPAGGGPLPPPDLGPTGTLAGAQAQADMEAEIAALVAKHGLLLDEPSTASDMDSAAQPTVDGAVDTPDPATPETSTGVRDGAAAPMARVIQMHAPSGAREGAPTTAGTNPPAAGPATAASPATAGLGRPVPPPTTSTVATVATRPLRDRIVDVVPTDATVTRAQIVETLSTDGRRVDAQQVTNWLSKLVQDGVLLRPQTNQYIKAS